MKKLLIMLTLLGCAVVWRGNDVLAALVSDAMPPAAHPVPIPTTAVPPVTPPTTSSIAAAGTATGRPVPNALTMEEFAGFGRTNPQAYRKFTGSRAGNERTATDKLMNFFVRGRYE